MDAAARYFPVLKVKNTGTENTQDQLAVEEPLEIRLAFYDSANLPVIQTLSVTMRTPGLGQDIELAIGFLLTEGVIQKQEDIQEMMQVDEHIVLVHLVPYQAPDLQRLERHFYTSSSCGVCGKTSIDAVKNICPVEVLESFMPVSLSLIYTLPHRVNELQATFSATGGLHAAALFDNSGEPLLVREDVGRHNALDKL